MAIKANATTVISNTPNIDFARLTGITQIVTSIAYSSTGDGVGVSPYPINGVSYTAATFTLNLTQDTNCACDCACAQCMCDCTPGG